MCILPSLFPIIGDSAFLKVLGRLHPMSRLSRNDERRLQTR
jgi:hypothetical protein